MLTFHFSLPDVVCIKCVPSIKNTIIEYQKYVDSLDEHAVEFQSLHGIQKIRIKTFQIDSVCKTLTIDVYDESCKYADLLKILNTLFERVGQSCDAILEAEDEPAPPVMPATSNTGLIWLHKTLRAHWFQGAVGVIAGVALLVLSLVTGGLPLIALMFIAVISVALTLALGAEFYIKAKNQIQDRDPAMDTLFALSTVIIIIVSIAAFFVPGLPMMFEAALLIFGFRHVGLAIRDSIYNAMGVRDGFQAKAPKSVLKMDKNNCPVPTKLTVINTDDVILILPNGHMIPIDGWCDLPASEGLEDAIEERSILVSNINGSTLPRQFKHGDRLLAGMVLAPGEKPMRMRVGVEGYHLKLAYHVPNLADIHDHEMLLYLDRGALYFAAKNSEGKTQSYRIRSKDLRDEQGVNHAKDIRAILNDPACVKKLEIEHYDQIFSVTSKAGFVGAPAIKSYLARLDRAIQIEEKSKGPLQKQTETILSYFIPAVFLLAILSGVVISFFFPPAVAILCAVSVLVSACPCTLGLITPLAFKIGMKKAAGVTFSHGQALEGAATIDCVVFDLNGTLTTGEPVVDASQSELPDEFLPYLATLEQHSTHPIAKAIYAFSGGDRAVLASPLHVEDLDQKSNHSGISAKINGQIYSVGNQDMMSLNGVDTSTVKLRKPLEPGDTLVYLAREKTVIGFMVLHDPVRNDADRVIDLLKKRGHKICICTGADEETAFRYADELKIDRQFVRASRTGVASHGVKNDKKAYIRELQSSGYRVAMIGDAANDGVAMAASDFSIAIRHLGGNETTQQRAGAVIEGGSLLPIVTAFEVSKQTMANIKQNLLFSLSYNILAALFAGGLLLTLGVVLNPGVGVALMIVQTCLLLLNAYRFQQQPLAHLKPVPVDASNKAHDMGETSHQTSYVNSMRKLLGRGSSPHLQSPPAARPHTYLPSDRLSRPSSSAKNVDGMIGASDNYLNLVL